MADVFPPLGKRKNVPLRERSYACAVCGWGPSTGIHLPALTGPRKGQPWGHAYASPRISTGAGVQPTLAEQRAAIKLPYEATHVTQQQLIEAVERLNAAPGVAATAKTVDETGNGDTKC